MAGREIDELREQSNAALAASRREIDELREQSNAALAASRREIDELRQHVQILTNVSVRLRGLLAAAKCVIFDVLNYPGHDWPWHNIEEFLRNADPEIPSGLLKSQEAKDN